MNQSRIWLVVKPSIGLPLFLGSVAVTSLLVHGAILSNTTWMASYWQGGKAKAAATTIEAPAVAEAATTPQKVVFAPAPASTVLASVAVPGASATDVATTPLAPR